MRDIRHRPRDKPMSDKGLCYAGIITIAINVVMVAAYIWMM